MNGLFNDTSRRNKYSLITKENILQDSAPVCHSFRLTDDATFRAKLRDLGWNQFPEAASFCSRDRNAEV